MRTYFWGYCSLAGVFRDCGLHRREKRLAVGHEETKEHEMNQRGITDYEKRLSERPARAEPVAAVEKYLISTTGGGPFTWTGRITDHITYNWYHVQPVCIGEPGSLPVALGPDRTACNLAESFMDQGTLAVGTYVVFRQVGEYYVFDHKP